MTRASGVARVFATSLLGVVVLLGISRYLLSVDIPLALSRALEVPAWVLLLALAVRCFGPILHSTQFHFVLKSLDYRIGYRKTLLIVYSTLALEYVVPVGGATEVGRVVFLVREGLPSDGAVQATFLHRLTHSLFLIFELALVILWTVRVNAVILWLLVAVVAVNALNASVIAATRHPRVSAALARVTSRIGSRTSYPKALAKPSVPPLGTVLLFVALEKASAVASGYLLLSHLESSISVVHSLVIFDVLLATFWLIPVVTPAGIGQVEAVQVIASSVMNLESGSVLLAAVLYRLITLASVLPQLLPVLLRYGGSEILSIVAGDRSR